MSRALAALASVSALALAAPARADFQLWNEVGASAEVADGVRLGFDQELRLDQGASEIDMVRPAAWVSWRAAKWLSLRLGYRYEIEPHFTKGADYADGWHEGWADAVLRRKVDRLRLSLRLRYQEKQGSPWDADGETLRTHSLRQRLEAEWPLWRKLSVVGSGELFMKLADSDGLLDKWRAAAGLGMGLGAHEFGLRYLLEYPLTPGDEIAHVIALSYQYAR